MDGIDQFFQDSHYNIIRVLLGISGLWPFHKQNRRYTIYLVMILIYGSGFIFQMLGVFKIRHDLFELIDAVPMLFYSITTMSKMFCTIYTLPQIKVLLIKMQEYCLSSKSDEENKIQNSHALYGRKLGYAYTAFDSNNCELQKFFCKIVILLSHSILYITGTLFTRFFHAQSNETNESPNKVASSQTGLLYRVNYMVDLETYYFPIFIHTAICGFSYTFLLVVFDVLYLTTVEYCCGLFAALRYRLENALVFENDKLMMTTTKDKSYTNIVYCIHRHTETMQFVAIIESVYSLSIFIQIGLFIFIISFLGYQMINTTENVSHLLKPAAYLNGALIFIFFQNWQGQKIIDSSEAVFESAYNAEWYNMPIASRKLLIMMMMRSEKPSMVTIGKIVVLSYVTFNMVLRTSSSYFMLLRSL